jgi:MFS transporter, AAHS family, 4-hydroxybenzoate transporter
VQTEASTTFAIPAVRLHIRVAWLCGMVLFLEGYDIASAGFAIPLLVDAWKIPPSVFTAALTAGNVGLMLGSLLAGPLGDRRGRKPVLIGCVMMFGAFSLLTAFVSSPLQLAILRFLTCVGLGGGLPLAATLTADVAPPDRPGQLVILASVGISIGHTGGGLLAHWLMRFFGWPVIFVIGGALPLMVAPLLAVGLPDSIGRQVAPRRKLAAALFQHGLAPSTLLLWAINILNLLALYFILLWLPAVLHGMGLSSSRAVLASTIYGLGVLASPLLASIFVDRIGIERVLACCLAFGALCVLSIGLVGPSFWLLCVVICGAGFGGGCQGGINSLSALAYPPAIRSTGAGWASGVGRMGTIGAGLLGGALLALSFRTQKIFVAASIPAFGAALLMAILGRMRGNPGGSSNRNSQQM